MRMLWMFYKKSNFLVLEYIKVEFLSVIYFRTESVSNVDYFRIFGIFSYNELLWRQDSSPKTKYIMFPLHLTHIAQRWFLHKVRCGIFHLWYHVGTQKVIDFKLFCVFRLELLSPAFSTSRPCQTSRLVMDQLFF